MQYLLSAITALLLAIGQSLWKLSAAAFNNQGDESLIKAISKVIFTPNFIIGAFLYIVATMLYLWLFSKYPFYAVQILLVSFSLIFSLLVSNFIFKEQINLVNYLGIPLILIGAVLVIWQK
ncbi:TPA: hypothetical protein DDW69_00940 [candidate division CPR2 bacterium]|nr:MAG: hypothetical protein A2Y26_03110 [candidate division CPR2 bacterium GWD2_39_7]HBG81386.1 hypothetical protein [candidate division CPR2 bacterium]HCL99331.1 hypothetical protein [candidate division CPR2 bacterium]